jgi:ring-1,2-phenylacetyl-CoA epoxidase subunit PaaE
MSKFHKLKVIDVREETDDCKSIAFEVPKELQEEFKYLQGQHLTLKGIIGGEDVRRNYSLCSSPLENEWRVAVKKLPEGKFSTFANEQLRKGDYLEVMPPAGHFHTEIKAGNKKNYILFAAGSGITPMMSIMKTVLRTEPESTVTLVYGNKNTLSIIFHEEIEGLKNKYMNRLSVYYLLSREKLEETIFNGRITTEKCSDLFNGLIDVKTGDEFFICGPESMIHAVNDSLKDAGVTEEKIHFELFSSPGSEHGAAKMVISKEDEGKVSQVTVTSDGKTFTFDLPYGQSNLLDAAMREGADLPFACKGGVCCTCKARVLEGEVEMERNYALVKEEVEAGFILTCQAFPKTEKVVINFDDI